MLRNLYCETVVRAVSQHGVELVLERVFQGAGGDELKIERHDSTKTELMGRILLETWVEHLWSANVPPRAVLELYRELGMTTCDCIYQLQNGFQVLRDVLVVPREITYPIRWKVRQVRALAIDYVPSLASSIVAVC